MQNRINNLGEYVIDRSVEIRNGNTGNGIIKKIKNLVSFLWELQFIWKKFL